MKPNAIIIEILNQIELPKSCEIRAKDFYEDCIWLQDGYTTIILRLSDTTLGIALSSLSMPEYDLKQHIKLEDPQLIHKIQEILKGPHNRHHNGPPTNPYLTGNSQPDRAT